MSRLAHTPPPGGLYCVVGVLDATRCRGAEPIEFPDRDQVGRTRRTTDLLDPAIRPRGLGGEHDEVVKWFWLVAPSELTGATGLSCQRTSEAAKSVAAVFGGRTP